MIEFWRKITKTDIRNTMAMVWVVCSFIFLFKLLTKAIPEQNKEVVIAVVGIVLGKLVDIMGYYFGQSKTEVDKEKKDETI